MIESNFIESFPNNDLFDIKVNEFNNNRRGSSKVHPSLNFNDNYKQNESYKNAHADAPDYKLSAISKVNSKSESPLKNMKIAKYINIQY